MSTKVLLAIRQNTMSKANPTEREVNVAVYTMKRNIIVTLNHCVHSPDPAKQHHFCPVGQSSWCKWQQDSATGTSTYNPDDCLPKAFFDLLCSTFIKDVCICMQGETQNCNKCITRYTVIQ